MVECGTCRRRRFLRQGARDASASRGSSTSRRSATCILATFPVTEGRTPTAMRVRGRPYRKGSPCHRTGSMHFSRRRSGPSWSSRSRGSSGTQTYSIFCHARSSRAWRRKASRLPGPRVAPPGKSRTRSASPGRNCRWKSPGLRCSPRMSTRFPWSARRQEGISSSAGRRACPWKRSLSSSRSFRTGESTGSGRLDDDPDWPARSGTEDDIATWKGARDAPRSPSWPHRDYLSSSGTV